MSDDKQDLRLLITEGQRQAVVNACLKFTVEEREGIPAIHISDVIHALVLQKLKEQDKATLPPGEYSVALTCAIVDLTPDLEIDPEVAKRMVSEPPPLPISLTEDDVEFIEDEDAIELVNRKEDDEVQDTED